MTSERLVLRLLRAIEFSQYASATLNAFELVRHSIRLDGPFGGKASRIQSTADAVYASDLGALELVGLVLTDIYSTFDFEALRDRELGRLLSRACLTHEEFVFGLSIYESSQADLKAHEVRSQEDQATTHVQRDTLRRVRARSRVLAQEFHGRCANFRLALDKLYAYRDQIASDAFKVPPPSETNQTFVRENGK